MRKASSIGEDAKGHEDPPIKKTRSRQYTWTEAESDKDHCLLLLFSKRIAFIDGLGNLLSMPSGDICRVKVDANMLTVIFPPNNQSAWARYHAALLKGKVVV